MEPKNLKLIENILNIISYVFAGVVALIIVLAVVNSFKNNDSGLLNNTQNQQVK